MHNNEVSIGDKFGHWTVIELYKNGGKCLCECDCEDHTRRVIRSSTLTNGHTKSCGCVRNNKIKVGDKFGRWTVISYAGKTDYGAKQWWCECECTPNKLHKVFATSLLTGRSKSCGCYSREFKHNLYSTHGMTKTRFYKLWGSAIRRCTDVKNKSYEKYGGRGITVCDRWMDSFENFRDDMYESYLEHVEKYGEKDTTLDRIDSNGNYCPENCRWATCKLQTRNRACNSYITYLGKTMCITEWAEYLGMSRNTIYHRKYKLKLEDPELLLAPPWKLSKLMKLKATSVSIKDDLEED